MYLYPTVLMTCGMPSQGPNSGWTRTSSGQHVGFLIQTCCDDTSWRFGKDVGMVGLSMTINHLHRAFEWDMLLQSGKFSIHIPVGHTFLVTLVTSPLPVFLSLSSLTKPSAGKNFGDRSMVHSTVCQSMPQILKLQSGWSRHQMERDAAEKNQNMWPFLTNSYNDVRNTEEHRRNPKLDFYNYVM